MTKLNSKGPENSIEIEGRKLGLCTQQHSHSHLGIGMGLRRNSGGGKGLGKRIQSGQRQC